ncbi:MAG: ABC transporter permease, partial [Candidatus Omnitrophica bacterium]|nr:ABC transporter permease [Candidatus Omnitrophota bacterium]
MNRLICILRKEFIQITRDKRLLGPILVAPMIQLILFGYVATLDIKHISTIVCDLDSSLQSRDFIERFEASDYFDLN